MTYSKRIFSLLRLSSRRSFSTCSLHLKSSGEKVPASNTKINKVSTPPSQTSSPSPITPEMVTDISSLFREYNENPPLFRMKPFVTALSVLAKDIDADNFKNALEIASREGALWHLREMLYEISLQFGNELINHEVNVQKLYAMNGKDVDTKDLLVQAWRAVADKDAERSKVLFKEANPDFSVYDYKNESIFEWLQILAANADIQQVGSVTFILRKQLNGEFDGVNFKLDQNSRKKYFNLLQRITQHDFDAHYEKALQSLQSLQIVEGESKTTPEFENWFNFISENYFFKSLKYNKTKTLKNEMKRQNKDEAPQEYYRDLVPSSLIFTKTIILLAKFDRWEEAAYLYNEARQRSIGMRPVTLYAQEFYDILPKLQVYTTLGHIDPMKINIGNLFDFKNLHREHVLNKLHEVYKGESL